MSFARRNICETVLWFLCLRVLLITRKFSEKNLTTQKSCYCNPRNTRQFEKSNYINASTSPQKLQISGFQFDPANPPPAFPEFSFLAAWLVGMFLRMWKMSSNPLHLPPVPQLKNFAWVVLTLPYQSFLIQLLIYLFFHIIKDENLFDFKSTKKKFLIGILQLTFFKKPVS